MKTKLFFLFLLVLPLNLAAQTPGCISAGAFWSQPILPAITATGGTILVSVAPPNVTSDTVVGFSQGVPTAYANLGPIVRFENGTIQAMSGGSSTATDAYIDAKPPISYVVPPAGQYYLVTFKIDPIGQHTYSVLITPPGGTQVLLASGLKFRSPSQTATGLDHAGGATGNGIAQVCNIQVVAPVPPATVTYTGSTTYTATGNVPYNLPVSLNNCTAVVNVMTINVTCPAQTGTIPYFSSGNVPYSVTFDFQGLPPGCVPQLLPNTTTISFTGCAPLPPAISSCTVATGSHSVTLSWTASSSSGVTGYNVYRSTTSGNGATTGGPYTLLAANVQGVQFIDSNVAQGTTYYYVVTALNPQGESIYSNEASAVIPATGTGTVKAVIPPKYP